MIKFVSKFVKEFNLKFEDDDGYKSDFEVEEIEEVSEDEKVEYKSIKDDSYQTLGKYMCKKCFMIFKYKSNYERHLERKTECGVPMCEKCGKKFTRHTNLRRHKNCKKPCVEK